MSNIKLSPLIKEWLFNVLLQNIGLQRPITMFLLSPQYCLYLVDIQTYYNTIAPICILPRLHYPCVVLVNAITVLTNGFTDGIVSLTEFQVLVVLKTLLDVERQGQVVKHILVYL